MRDEPVGEWPATLDVSALIATGWRPAPFQEFVAKIHSRCDLSCDYCYMYEMADQSWRDRPRCMTSENADYTAFRIGEHARAHHMESVTLILHGGEPLLAGRDLISRLVTTTRREAGNKVRVEARVQTNGVGLNDRYLELFGELGIRVGVSLDGTAKAHDRHRRFASGRGSHSAVTAGLHRLMRPPFRPLFSGLLCTVDLRNDPVETYEALLGYDPPRIDFLLPHGTWAEPPPRRIADGVATPYAEWLIPVFDLWYHQAPQTSVRLFQDIIHLILGGDAATETVGLSPSRMLVIETDGSVEQVDTLKIAYQGAADTGLHVARDPFDSALTLPGIVARQMGARGLSAKCRACKIHRVCGGGTYAHRYRPGSGFANPSVYCPDLMRLIDHILRTVRTDVTARRGRMMTR
jgi:uncharacterized protein